MPRLSHRFKEPVYVAARVPQTNPIEYGDPQLVRMNVRTTLSDAEITMYGPNYRNYIVAVCPNDAPINELDVVWVGATPDPDNTRRTDANYTIDSIRYGRLGLATVTMKKREQKVHGVPSVM